MKQTNSRMRGPLLGVVLGALSLALGIHVCRADPYDAAVAHAGRPAHDLKRDPIDHPAEVLRLAGIKPGMRVADFLAADGYYSELLSYLVGPQGHVLMLNNAAYDHFSDGEWQARVANHRLPNVEHRTIDLDHMDLGSATLDAVLLIKVYHDLYWVDPKGAWPKVNVAAVLDQIVRALKPGGVLLLVDHSAKAGTGSDDASRLHRIDEAFTRADFEKRGLELTATSDVLRRPDDARDQITYLGPMVGKTDRFVLVFHKPRT
jgi:predicted methyltransferase